MARWARIRKEVLTDGRAEYGEQILPTLSAKLVRDYGQGFSTRNLGRMVQIVEVFPDENIVKSLSQQLSWSHFIEILPLKQPGLSHLNFHYYPPTPSFLLTPAGTTELGHCFKF